MLAVATAIGAAVLYALASVLQHRAAVAQPAERALRVGLLVGLLRRPLWLVGITADGAGYVLQFVALATGALAVVQPLLVLSLLFALPLSAWFARQRPRPADVVAAVVVCAGLAAFLVAASPATGRANVGGGTWLVLLAVGGGVSVLLAAAGQRAGGPARPALLAAATAVLFGVAAALTKTTGRLLAASVPATFVHWQPYALVVAGGAGLVVGQSAFQAGSLELSLPTMSVGDPIVSVLIGALAFGERLDSSPGALAAEVVGLALTVAGVYALARSPTIRAVRAQSPDPPEARPDSSV